MPCPQDPSASCLPSGALKAGPGLSLTLRTPPPFDFPCTSSEWVDLEEEFGPW